MYYDTPEEALKACVAALGGNKKVGVMLWPDMEEDPARAGRKLSDLLNENITDQKPSLSQIVFIFKKAQAVGFHDGMNSWNRMCTYGPAAPLNTADLIAEAQRRVIAAIEQSDMARRELIRLTEESEYAIEPIGLRAVRS